MLRTEMALVDLWYIDTTAEKNVLVSFSNFQNRTFLSSETVTSTP